ncbi:hypothetical protein BS78_09G039400, partial [Paspalum vaginatum]
STASRNKSRCFKVAERVRCLSDTLQQLDTAGTDAARAGERLEEALCHSLRVVRRLFLASGGGQMSDALDEVESDINRCILDLAVASYVRIARLETLLLLRPQQDEAAPAAGKDDDGGAKEEEEEEDENDNGKRAAAVVSVPGCMQVGQARRYVTAVGVPACAAVAAAAGMHEHLLPPPSYGYGCHGNSGGPCDTTCSPNYSSYSYPYYPSMFSHDNPNACSIT